MMPRDDVERLFYLGAGPLTALLLGVFLIPLREVTTASNLAFAFMALTIVVSELGGRGPAIATALVSALSLDFFLTQPYLRLSMDDKHDLIAFAALAACGLIAASLGSHRGERIAALTRVRKHRELLHAALAEWERGAPAAPQIERILRAACHVLPLAAAVVRDERGAVVASSDGRAAMRELPKEHFDATTLAPASGGGRSAATRSPLPAGGGRIALASGTTPRGWLDVWGNGMDAGADDRRTVVDLARLAGIALAGRV